MRSASSARPATREGAVEFRHALEELGTTCIKLGQLLSSRPDLLPDVYIEELGKLVDDIPPDPFEQIRQVIDSELGVDIFAEIDPEPLGSSKRSRTSSRCTCAQSSTSRRRRTTPRSSGGSSPTTST